MGDLWLRLREWVEEHLTWKTLGAALVLVAVVAFCGGNVYEDWRAKGDGLTLVDEAPKEATTQMDTAATSSSTAEPTEVVVHVDGAVTSPGVYTLKNGARVDDAVRAAGAKAEADLSQLNLAQRLTDGQKITVPLHGEPAAAAPATTTATATSSEGASAPEALVNINTASLEELETLPNIGEVRAKAIIEYREKTPFTSIDQLQEVSGIGEKTFANMKAYVTV